MKKLSIVLATAGLMALAACNKSPQAEAVENAGDNAAASMDNQADMLESAADNTKDAADAKADAINDNSAGK